MQQVAVDFEGGGLLKLDVVQDLELASVTEETHGNLLGKGSAFDSFNLEGLYSIKNKEDVTLKNNSEVQNNLFLRFAVKPCVEGANGVECERDSEEIKRYFASMRLGLMQVVNFIDYEDVRSVEGDVKFQFKSIEQ